MPFKKGNTEAKKKGKHEKTKLWDELGDFIIKSGAERAVQILMTCEDKDFMTHYNNLLEYFQPKLARNTIVGDKENPITVNMMPVGSRRTDK